MLNPTQTQKQLDEIIELLKKLVPQICRYCGGSKDAHCGGGYWCYKNYHTKKPTQFHI